MWVSLHMMWVSLHMMWVSSHMMSDALECSESVKGECLVFFVKETHSIWKSTHLLQVSFRVSVLQCVAVRCSVCCSVL